jgi:hypothetical protein
MLENHNPKAKGLNGQALKAWAALFLTLGIAGKSLIENSILSLSSISTEQLFQMFEADSSTMLLAAVALILKAAYTCAAPIVAFLLVEGFLHTSDALKYGLRLFGVALLSELPYNLAMGGQILVTDSRNPVFGLVICLAMLFFFQQFTDKGLKNTLIKFAIVLLSLLWVGMLRIEDGCCLVVLTAVLWLVREKDVFRNMMGCSAGLCCMLFSPFYLASPISFLAIHFYNGGPGPKNRLVNYLSYPVILLAFGLISVYL